MAEFRYFVPDKKFRHYSSERLLLFFWLITFLFGYLEDSATNYDFETIKIFSVLISFCFTIYLLIASFFTYKPLKGKFDGTIIFSPQSIILKETQIETSKIHKLKLAYNDICGDVDLSPSKQFAPRKSRGIGNYLEFTYEDGEVYLVYFEITSKVDQQKLQPFIAEMERLNKFN